MESLGYTALDIAKWFINAADRESGDAITHLKVQKLIYYAQGWSLVYFKRPLFDEDLEAWAHGPVAVSVWKQYRDCGFEAIPEQRITRKVSGNVVNLLAAVDSRYGIYTAKQLERMTHKEQPWKAARGDLPPEAASTAKISKAQMKTYFGRLKDKK